MHLAFIGNSSWHTLPFLTALMRAGLPIGTILCPLGRPRDTRLSTLKQALRRSAPHLPDVVLERLGMTGFARGLSQVARQLGARLLVPGSVNDPELLSQLGKEGPEVTVCGGLSQILRPAALAGLGEVWNLHPSLLPAYRGPTPLFWTLRRGEVEGGVTVHRVTEQIDAGAILGQVRLPIEPWLSSGELLERCATHAAAVVKDLVERRRRGELVAGTPQGEGSYFRAVGDGDVVLSGELLVREAFDIARAAAPFLAVRIPTPEGEIQAQGASPHPGVRLGSPGTVLTYESGRVALQCQDGVLVFARAFWHPTAPARVAAAA